MSSLRDVGAKIRNIGMLLAAADNPWPLVRDSLHLQRHPYTARLKSGLSFTLQPRCGDWFTLLECVVRRDYFQDGIELRTGDTVIDIGANFGAFSIAASRLVGDSGKVWCYEPNPFVFERLEHNLRINGCRNVTAFNEAVQGRSGDIDLFVDRKSAFSTTHPEVDGRLSSTQPTRVPMLGIDAALERAGRSVALLKMDCEGAEYDILQHLTPGASSTVRQVVMEVHRIPGESVDSIPQRLGQLGFDVRPTTPLTAFRRPPTASGS